MGSDILKYLIANNINDGLLRDFVYKERWEAVRDQIEIAKEKYKKKIEALDVLAKNLPDREDT